MKYYYDIYLNFFEYPVNYYEWDKKDDIERVIKIPVIKVSDIRNYIIYECSIDTDLEQMILTDGISSVALELIDKKVAFLSYLPYEDELSINELASTMEISSFDVSFYKKRKVPDCLRIDEMLKKVMIKTIEEADDSVLKYMYFEITDKEEKSIDKIKSFLKKDITSNFDNRYVELYYKICKPK